MPIVPIAVKAGKWVLVNIVVPVAVSESKDILKKGSQKVRSIKRKKRWWE